MNRGDQAMNKPQGSAPSFRIVALGYHKVPTLEIDVTPEQQRQLDSAWTVATMFGSPHGISGDIATRYNEVQRRILGFDYEAEFARLCPDRSPQITTRVRSESSASTSAPQQDTEISK